MSYSDGTLLGVNYNDTNNSYSSCACTEFRFPTTDEGDCPPLGRAFELFCRRSQGEKSRTQRYRRFFSTLLIKNRRRLPTAKRLERPHLLDSCE